MTVARLAYQGLRFDPGSVEEAVFSEVDLQLRLAEQFKLEAIVAGLLGNPQAATERLAAFRETLFPEKAAERRAFVEAKGPLLEKATEDDQPLLVSPLQQAPDLLDLLPPVDGSGVTVAVHETDQHGAPLKRR